jgi:hypothetical protein
MLMEPDDGDEIDEGGWGKQVVRFPPVSGFALVSWNVIGSQFPAVNH